LVFRIVDVALPGTRRDHTQDDNHTLHIVGNAGDVLDLDTEVTQWNDSGKVLDANGFDTYTAPFNAIDLILKVENSHCRHLIAAPAGPA
jgi:hypothetical protein